MSAVVTGDNASIYYATSGAYLWFKNTKKWEGLQIAYSSQFDKNSRAPNVMIHKLIISTVETATKVLMIFDMFICS